MYPASSWCNYERIAIFRKLVFTCATTEVTCPLVKQGIPCRSKLQTPFWPQGSMSMPKTLARNWRGDAFFKSGMRVFSSPRKILKMKVSVKFETH